MKLEELNVVITRLEDGIDKDGNSFLKAKGYNPYKGVGRNAYNFFSNVKLYPISQEQLDQTKERLFCQTDDKPKLKIKVYQSELSTPLNNGRLLANLVVYRYDFAKNKLYSKKKLLNFGKEK